MRPALVLLMAYLLGAIPFGFLLVKWKTGRDVRSMGSGNIGATNVLRATGRWLGIVTLLLDIGKGYLAVWLAALLTGGDPLWISTAALAVMAGHAFPAFLKFKGGKAVASFVGASLYLAPLAVAVALLIFFVVVARTRFISLGSMVGAVSFPLAAWLIAHPPWPVQTAAILAAAFVVWRHKENITRLRDGTESVLSLGGRRS
jgi:glycerol-3-phosphate acyltransferase PlsY